MKLPPGPKRRGAGWWHGRTYLRDELLMADHEELLAPCPLSMLNLSRRERRYPLRLRVRR